MPFTISLSSKKWLNNQHIRALPPHQRAIYLDLAILANESQTRGKLDASDLMALADQIGSTPQQLEETIRSCATEGIIQLESDVILFPEIIKKETARQRRLAMSGEKTPKRPTTNDRLDRLEQTLQLLVQEMEKIKSIVRKLTKAVKPKRKKPLATHEAQAPVDEELAFHYAIAAKRKQELAAIKNPEGGNGTLQDPTCLEEIQKKKSQILEQLRLLEDLKHETASTTPPPETTQDQITPPPWLEGVDPELYKRLLQTRYADILIEPQEPPWPHPKEDQEIVRAYKRLKKQTGWTNEHYIMYSRMPEVAQALEEGKPIEFPSGAVIMPEMPCYRLPEKWREADKIISFRQLQWKDCVVIPHHPLVDPPRPDGDSRPIVDRRPLDQRPYLKELLDELKAQTPLRPLKAPEITDTKEPSDGRLFGDIPPKSQKIHPKPTVIEADPDDTSPEVAIFPVKGDAKFFRIRKNLVEALQARYQIDVRTELAKALSWVEAHHSRRKTAKGMMRFLIGWLNRACQYHQQQASAPATLNNQPKDWRVYGYEPTRHPDDRKYAVF